ncbi:MAG: 4Fe-4S cluster-binding domain-containing protein, partial [Treponema sp.]|nr:4Fe-4S cluster-binding domain-containing protein [Treponema sp.]
MIKSKINSKNNTLEISHFYSSCKQCPRACGVFRGEKSTLGFCKESDKLKLASACLHFGEEPLVTVFGGSGTLFFTGCTLRCAFCQNYQISQNGMGSEISSEDFVKICIRLEESGAENINLV